MQKTGKTEQGKYSAKYALSELLVCGECGTPYKRCTWARNGKKRIVWRCISRLEFGTAYCHKSPTLDEAKIHRAVVVALNEYGAIRAEVKDGVLELAGLAQSHGVSLLGLRRRLDALAAEQAHLLDEILEDMNNSELNASLKALMEEKQSILDQIQALEKDETQQSLHASRQREMEEWHGGMAQRIRPSVIHLLRGQIFDIQGKTFFTMGGGSNHDIAAGILEPDDPQFKRKCRILDHRRALYRENHLSWWKEELPSEEEYRTARANLDQHGWKVDYIITHCGPTSVQDELSGGFYKTDALTDFLDEVAKRCRFRNWFLGHYHTNAVIREKFAVLYEQIIRLKL